MNSQRDPNISPRGRRPESASPVPELMRVRQSHAGLLLMGVVLAVAVVAGLATLGNPAPAPSAPLPTSLVAAVAASATPGAGRSRPSPAAAPPTSVPTAIAASGPTVADVRGALGALGQLASYRFRYAGQGAVSGPFISTGVVVNGIDGGISTQTTSATAPAISVVTGARAWASIEGASYEPMVDQSGAQVTTPPFQLEIQALLGDTVGFVMDLGRGSRDGTPGRHLRLLVSAQSRPFVPGTGTTLDVWIADDGHLIGAEGTNLGLLPSFDGQSIAWFDASVSGINDPANRIGDPTAPVSAPGGSTGGTSSVDAAAAALGRLRSYRLTIQGGASATIAALRRTVVNRPSPAVQEDRQLRHGNGRLSLRLVAGRLWSRTPGGAWKPADVVTETSCPISAGSSATEAVACALARLTDLSAMGETIGDAFTEVGDHESVNGVAALHLHSDAGVEVPGLGAFAGRIDLWIADHGGFLVRLAVTGDLPLEVDVTHVNDPGNAVMRP